MRQYDEDEVRARAMKAYWRGRDPLTTMQPAGGGTFVMREGVGYVVMGSGGRLYAVYRVSDTGKVRKVEKYPAGLAKLI